MIRWVKIMVDLPSPEVVKDNPIVVVKNQNLSNEELVKFASTLGRVWDDSQFSGLQQTIQRGNSVEDSSVVNVSHDGALKRINVPWHVDLSHYPIQVLPNRLLYSIEEKNPTPTIFFNSSIALIRRRDKLEELKNLSAYHLAPYETPWTWPVKRPVVHKHPWKDYYSFVCPGGFAKEIEGQTKSNLESKMWVEALVKEIWTDELEYVHHYEKGDLVIYDNYTVIHRRESFKGERILKRVTWEPFID